MTTETKQYFMIRRTIAGFGALGFATLSFLTAAVWWRIWSLWHIPAAHCDCGSVLAAIHPAWWGGAALLSLGWLAVVGRADRSWLRYTRITRATLRRLDGRVANGVAVLDDDRPQAWTVGLLRPTIIVTTALRAQLTANELAAVIAHERAHQAARDPLWSAALDAVRAGFGWLPWIQSWTAAAYSLRELAADAVATDGYRRTNDLSSAILKLAQAAPTAWPAFSPNRDRVEKLLNHDWRPAIRWWTVRSMVGMAVVAASVVFGVRLVMAQATPPAGDVHHACVALQRICVQSGVDRRSTETIRLRSASIMSRLPFLSRRYAQSVVTP